MATIKVQVTDLGNAIEFAQRDWVVAVMHLNGKVVKWKNNTYDSVPAPFGAAEIELPAGKYIIRASAHTWWANNILYGNWATDRAIVQVCCDDVSCVTLFAPTIQACWIPLFYMVFPELVRMKVLDKEVLTAIKTIDTHVSKLKSADFEMEEKQMLLGMFKKQKDKPQ